MDPDCAEVSSLVEEPRTSKQEEEQTMGKKKKRLDDVKPWCWYCDRIFEDEKILIQHQKAKHFKCHVCHKKMSTASGLKMHVTQVHKENITKVPNAKPGTDSLIPEITGMEGIPEEDAWIHEAKVRGEDPALFLQQKQQEALQRHLPPGNVPGGIAPIGFNPANPFGSPSLPFGQSLLPGMNGIPLPPLSPPAMAVSPPVEAPPLAQPQSPPSLPVKQEPIKVELVPPKSVSAFSLTPQPAQTFVPPAAAPSQQKLIFENENSSMEEIRANCDRYLKV